jgi:hypothetical protein
VLIFLNAGELIPFFLLSTSDAFIDPLVAEVAPVAVPIAVHPTVPSGKPAAAEWWTLYRRSMDSQVE